jgi:hypothetical protein
MHAQAMNACHGCKYFIAWARLTGWFAGFRAKLIPSNPKN